MRKIILLLALTLLSLVQTSCRKNDKKSILVIAVDELTMGDTLCSHDSAEKSGFQLLCNESIRFTHAFTPSTLTVPALTSALTGLYPYQHKVRHNGGPALPAETELVSELALRQDYRTSFFSGGSPVFRRSGLNQGFELFDDNIVPTFKSLFRPFRQNANYFFQWVVQDANSEPFFGVIYVPDLLFTTTETITDIGETRNLSFESQLDELDESLFELFQNLKSSGRWDKTTVILMGLNGHTGNDRLKEMTSLNLHGENTQVALFIKPAQDKKRDEAIQWKVDQNVSLVDVGRTLIELLGVSNADNSSAFPAHSLVPVLKSPNVPWPEDRAILLESGWAFWRKAGPIRTAAISNHVLLINDSTPRLYNTLVDRFEVNPLPMLQESILPTTQKLQNLFERNQFQPFPEIDSEWRTKLSIPYSRWMRWDQEPTLLKELKRLLKAQPRSLDILNWTAQIALNQKDWETLKQLGVKNKISTWQYVAERNLGTKVTKVQDSCFELLISKSLETDSLKQCSDSLFLELVDWIRADDRGLSKDAQRKKFERSFRNYMLDQQIQRTNIATGMIWDTSRDNSFAPSRTELALSLPEYTRTRSMVYRSLMTEDTSSY